MRLLAAFIMLAFLAAAAHFIHALERQNDGLPVVHVAEPANVVPWRLFTVCNPNRKNAPFIKPEATT